MHPLRFDYMKYENDEVRPGQDVDGEIGMSATAKSAWRK